MPGPLFNFSAYLGSIIAINAGYPFIVGTIVAWFGLFGPGVILVFAVRVKPWSGGVCCQWSLSDVTSDALVGPPPWGWCGIDAQRCRLQ
jgi:hypothetical protein